MDFLTQPEKFVTDLEKERKEEEKKEKALKGSFAELTLERQKEDVAVSHGKSEKIIEVQVAISEGVNSGDKGAVEELRKIGNALVAETGSTSWETIENRAGMADKKIEAALAELPVIGGESGNERAPAAQIMKLNAEDIKENYAVIEKELVVSQALARAERIATEDPATGAEYLKSFNEAKAEGMGLTKVKSSLVNAEVTKELEESVGKRELESTYVQKVEERVAELDKKVQGILKDAGEMNGEEWKRASESRKRRLTEINDLQDALFVESHVYMHRLGQHGEDAINDVLLRANRAVGRISERTKGRLANVPSGINVDDLELIKEKGGKILDAYQDAENSSNAMESLKGKEIRRVIGMLSPDMQEELHKRLQDMKSLEKTRRSEEKEKEPEAKGEKCDIVLHIADAKEADTGK